MMTSTRISVGPLTDIVRAYVLADAPQVTMAVLPILADHMSKRLRRYGVASDTAQLTVGHMTFIIHLHYNGRIGLVDFAQLSDGWDEEWDVQDCPLPRFRELVRARLGL
jgi:hypothetical protein